MVESLMKDDLPKIDQEWVDKKVGIICEACGSNMWLVTNTWRQGDGLVRRRVCRACGFPVHTIEQVRDD